MDVGTGLTVWYFVVFLLDFGTVLTVVFCCFSLPIEKNKIPHCQNSSNIHEKQQNTTLSEQFQ
jgi:hypothetical protein